MSETDDVGRTCTVQQTGTHNNDPFELPVGDRDDLVCGCPGCSEPIDEYLRLELPGIARGMAVPFAQAGFCSVDCLRGFHDMLPLLDVPRNEAECPTRDVVIEPATLVIAHVSHDGTRLRSFADYQFDVVLEDISQWGSENGYVGRTAQPHHVRRNSAPSLDHLSLDFNQLKP